MVVHRAVAALLVGIACVVSAGAGQKDAPVADVLAAATGYLEKYAPKVSGVMLQEEYAVNDFSGGSLRSSQRLSSDLVLLNLGGRVLAVRDAYAIDKNKLREHQPRIITLLAQPTPAAWEQVQSFPAESFRALHLPDDLIARSDDPTFALLYIKSDNQSRVTYKIDGKKKIDGVETVGLRFQETARPDASYIVLTSGKAKAVGRLWVDPATGRVHRTELTLESATENANAEVSYARDPSLDLWLPSQMRARFEVRELTGYNSYMTRSYQTVADYSSPKLTPIVLSGQ